MSMTPDKQMLDLVDAIKQVVQQMYRASAAASQLHSTLLDVDRFATQFSHTLFVLDQLLGHGGAGSVGRGVVPGGGSAASSSVAGSVSGKLLEHGVAAELVTQFAAHLRGESAMSSRALTALIGQATRGRVDDISRVSLKESGEVAFEQRASTSHGHAKETSAISSQDKTTRDEQGRVSENGTETRLSETTSTKSGGKGKGGGQSVTESFTESEHSRQSDYERHSAASSSSQKELTAAREVARNEKATADTERQRHGYEKSQERTTRAAPYSASQLGGLAGMGGVSLTSQLSPIRQMAGDVGQAVQEMAKKVVAGLQSMVATASPDAYLTLIRSVQLLGATVGQAFIPMIVKAAWNVQRLAHWFSELTDGQKSNIASTTAWALGIGAAVIGVSKLIEVAGNLATALKSLNGIGAFGGIGAGAAAAAAAVGLLAYALDQQTKKNTSRSNEILAGGDDLGREDVLGSKDYKEVKALPQEERKAELAKRLNQANARRGEAVQQVNFAEGKGLGFFETLGANIADKTWVPFQRWANPDNATDYYFDDEKANDAKGRAIAESRRIRLLEGVDSELDGKPFVNMKKLG